MLRRTTVARHPRPPVSWRVLPWLELILAALLCASPATAEDYALLIGINDYPHARPLKGAVNDILQIKRLVLEDLKFPEANVRVLLNEQATKANILAALRQLAEQTKPGDVVFWYYSGHGWVQNDIDGDEALLDPDDHLDEVLVPYDAVPWPRERALEPNPTMVVDDEIAVALSKMQGRRMLVVFDSCHSGTATRSLPGEEQTRALYENYALPATPKTRSLKNQQESMDMAGQVVFLAAASPVQAASDLGEYEGHRHGAFTAALLRSIQQQGPGWKDRVPIEMLFQMARKDMLEHGFATQSPSIAAREGLGKLTVGQFLKPSASTEIAALQSGGAFDVQMASNKYHFEDGELLEVAVESARDGYLYLFDIDAEQKVTQLLPNRFSPDNRIQAGVARQIPAKEDRYQFRAGKPFGRSIIVAIATTMPWAQADRLQLPSSFEAFSQLQENGLRNILRDLQDTVRTRSLPQTKGLEAQWASQKVIVQIVPKGAEAAAAQPAPEAPAAPAPPAPAAAAAKPPAPALPPPPGGAPATAAAAAPSAGASRALDDSNLTPEEQTNLPQARPELFAKLEKLAERFSPVFWQDVSGEFDSNFRPWRDFFVRYDFDQTGSGPNWPAPPQFQDENKRQRNHSLSALLAPNPGYKVTAVKETPGVYRVEDSQAGTAYQLDLRPVVYWAALTTSTHYFFHYLAFHGEDWKPLFGHTGDLEGTTIVVDRQTEKMVCAFTLAHDDVGVVRSLDDDADANIGVLVNPNAEARDLFDGDDGRPVDGSLGMEAGRDGEPAPKEHQEIYVESRGHGQYGPHKIHKSHYIIYATYFDEDTWTTPVFDKQKYPLAEKFGEVPVKQKYKLVYVGSGPTDNSRSAGEKTLWGEYHQVGRFAGGVNPPWDWRDNLFFKTGWWRDPRMIKKIGDPNYRLNPYLKK
jgi:uncharacterized caspase-like protein